MPIHLAMMLFILWVGFCQYYFLNFLWQVVQSLIPLGRLNKNLLLYSASQNSA